MAEVWTIEVFERGRWVEKDRVRDERFALSMFMARAGSVPNGKVRMKDEDGAVIAERNVDRKL